MFILVFRPHQRPAWATHYDCEGDFVDDFLNDYFIRSCNAECTGEDSDAIYGCETEEERYAIAIERVGHDLSCLTRLDSAEEVERYINERDYYGHHNKGYAAVEREAREIGWLNQHDDLCDTCMRSGVEVHRTDDDGNTICVDCDK